MQPFWHWLLFIAGFVLVLDVAVRRVALEPQPIIAAAGRLWDRLRGRVPTTEETPPFIDRLRARREQVAETLDRQAAMRFEGGDAPPEPPEAGGTPAPLPPRPPAPAPGMAPQQEAEPADFASRLMKAKKKVWEERDKGKNP